MSEFSDESELQKQTLISASNDSIRVDAGMVTGHTNGPTIITEPAQGLEPQPCTNGPLPQCKKSSSEPTRSVKYDVSPQWASNAISLTGTSVEISLEHLRSLYQDSCWDNKSAEGTVDLSQIISIALTPNFSGNIFSVKNIDSLKT